MSSIKEIYHEYLKSDEWNCLRELAKFRNKRKNNNTLTCVDCGLTHKKQYDVHHEHYPESNDYYNDDNSSFHVVLCHECHKKRHGLNGDDMMLIVKRTKNSFFGSHGAFLACFPSYLGLYLDLINELDLGEHKPLFEMLEYHHNFNNNIDLLLSNVEKSSMDDNIKSNFCDHVANIRSTATKITTLNDSIVQLTMKKQSIDPIAIMVDNAKKGELKKEAIIEEEKVSDNFDRMLLQIKKHMRKELRRL